MSILSDKSASLRIDEMGMKRLWSWDFEVEEGKGGEGRRMTDSARIAIDALESTAIEFVLADLVVHSTRFYDTAAVSLHVLIRACCCPCCAWDLGGEDSICQR